MKVDSTAHVYTNKMMMMNKKHTVRSSPARLPHYWSLLVVLFLSQYCFCTASASWGYAAPMESRDLRSSGDEDPAGEFPMPALDTSEHIDNVKRALHVQTRQMKSCGNGKFCPGTCCGKSMCCKKAWTCRYMPRIRSFYCIP